MRILCGVLVGILAAASAGAQVVTLGVGASGNWEWNPQSRPSADWSTGDIKPAVFVGIPIDGDTTFRLRAVEFSHDILDGGQLYTGSLRGFTAGIDYFLEGIFGRAVVSAGVGAYKQLLDSGTAPSSLESTKLGWYVGAGEWFELTQALSLAVEVSWNQAKQRSEPRILAATASLVFAF